VVSQRSKNAVINPPLTLQGLNRLNHVAVSCIGTLVHAVQQGTGVGLRLSEHRLGVRVSLVGMGGEFAP